MCRKGWPGSSVCSLAADDEVSVAVRVDAYTFASFMEMFLGHAAASMKYAWAAVDLAEAADERDPAMLAFALAGLASGARDGR